MDEGAKLIYAHALGLKHTTSNSIEHVTDDSIVYLVGNHVSIFNYEDRTHKFILKSNKIAEIVSFAVSWNRKYVALSERLLDNKGVQISVYNFHTSSRVRTLSYHGLTRSNVTAMSFSKDNKYISAVIGSPEWSVSLWQLDKAKLLSHKKVSFPITQVTINPWSHWNIATTGPEDMKIWRLTEGELEHFSPVAGGEHTFTCHQWFDNEKLLIGTNEGYILVVEGQSVKAKITPFEQNEVAITSIAIVARGFICGTESGQFFVYERTYDADYYNLYKQFHMRDNNRITDISVAPNEDSVVLVNSANEMSHFSLANVDILKENDPDNFPSLHVGFHSDIVSSLDVCIQKPLLVTAGSDRTVRIWNYIKRIVEITKTFEEDVYSVAIHPTGLRLLVGSRFKLYLYDVLQEDLRLCYEWQMKNCREVKFSRGGHRFAAVSAMNISIIDSNTFEIINTLRGHSGLVKAICWGKNDLALVSAGHEGAVYKWNLETFLRDEENVVRSCAYSSVVIDDTEAATPQNNIDTGAVKNSNNNGDYKGKNSGPSPMKICACGSDNLLRYIEGGETIQEIPSTKTGLSKVCLSKVSKTLFAGTTDGSLLLYRWPVTEKHYKEYQVHSGAIIAMALSNEEKHLFTAGVDGSLFMFDIESYVEGRLVTKKQFNFDLFEDVSLVLKSDIDDKNNAIRELQDRISQIELDCQLKIKQTNDDCSEKLRQQKTEYEIMLKNAESKYKTSAAQMEDAIARLKEQMATMEDNYIKQIDELEDRYDLKIKQAEDMYENLKIDTEEAISNYEDEKFHLEKEKNKELEKIRSEFEREKNSHMQAMTRLENDFVTMKTDYEHMLKQTEVEYESEIKSLKETAAQDLERERRVAVDANGKRLVAEKRLMEGKMEVKEIQKKLSAKEQIILKMTKKTEEDQGLINTLHDEIKTRNETISAQEGKINALMKQAEELEKLRYVLTFKYNQLRKDVAPNEENIREMRSKLNEMDTELQRVGLEKEHLRQAVNHREERGTLLHKEIDRIRRSLEDKNRQMTNLIRELSFIVAEGDPKTSLFKIKEIVLRFNASLLTGVVEKSEKDKLQEFERQRDYLEANLNSMKRSSSRKEDQMRIENNRKISENAMLVKEINQLRQEKKALSVRVQVLENQLRETAQQRSVSAQASTSAPRSVSALGGKSSSLSNVSDGSPARSTTRGKLMRGLSSRLSKASTDTLTLDRVQVAEMLAVVDRNNKEMERQQEEIRSLKEYINTLISRGGIRTPVSLHLTGAEGEHEHDPTDNAPIDSAEHANDNSTISPEAHSSASAAQQN